MSVAIRYDCSIYDSEGHRCRGLTELLCERRTRCPFYKTKEQVAAEEEKNAARAAPALAAKYEEQRAAKAEYSREWRRERMLQNICTRCGRPTDRPGKQFCSICAAKKKALEKEQKESEKMLNELLGRYY